MSDALVATTRLTGPAPEVGVTRDMVRRGLIVAPLMTISCSVSRIR